MFDPETLLIQGREASGEGRLDDARDLVAQAVAEARFVKDKAPLGKALRALGQAERALKHQDSAIQCYREAAAISLALGDRLAWAHAIRHVADILREHKRTTEAADWYSKVLEVYRTHPQALPLDHANALRGFALLKDSAGDTEEALLMWQGASTLYSTAGVAAGVAEAQGHIAFMLGR